MPPPDKITHEERLRHVEAVRRVAAVALLPLDPRVQRNTREVLDFLCAHVEELPATAGRLAVTMAADYIHRGTLINRRTVSAALDRLAGLGLIIRVRRASDRGATVWTLPTDLGPRAAEAPPVAANYWSSEEGRTYRHAGAALTADQAAADRQARLRREAARALRGRGALVTDDAISAEIARVSAQTPAPTPAQSSAQIPAQSSAQTSAQSSAPKYRETTSLRSASVGGADGLGASGTTALAPRSDGDGDPTGSASAGLGASAASPATTTNAATTTGPRTALPSPGPESGRSAGATRDGADTTTGAPRPLNPAVARFRAEQARHAAEQQALTEENAS